MTSFAVEGRFVITNNYRHAHIIDLCHSQLRELEYDFSSFFPTDSKKDPKNDPNVIYNVLNIFLVDLKSVLLCYYEHKDREEYQHLSFGEVDLENSRIIVHSPIHLPHQQVLMQVVGQTQESNLTDGVLAYCACEDYEHGLLQMITLDQNKELHAKTVLELPSPIMIYGLIGGHVYGFKMNEKYWKDYEKLLVISIATGEKFELKTTNCDLLGKQPKHCYDDKLVCIGKKMFMTRPFRDENKSRLFSLNLETYQWTNTGIEFEDRGYFLHTDAERTLIVSKWRMGRPEPIRPFYRFSVKPDLLQNLVWLAIKRRSDYDPSFYSHIIGQLPKKSKFRCPFFPLTEEEADRLANYN
ncbi:hypothetical protein M3Y94_01255900 [Aphelenchoides besseyi]|nr:hypothetical protein M3Y94_01255900 [Aphelenchoides besseyi]